MSESANNVPAEATSAIGITNKQKSDSLPVNPLITKIQLDLQNDEALSAMSQRYKHMTIKDNSKIVNQQESWFDRFKVSKNSSTAEGEEFIIDVQPDMRFPFTYIAFNCTQIYPLIEIKSHPSISLFSLIAYEIIIFSAFLLQQDKCCRKPKSLWAQPYDNDAQRQDYIRILLECHITESLAYLIEKFAAVRDPARPNCRFVPTLAGGMFAHDFGRLMPPQIFLYMHNALANLRTSTPPAEVKRQLHAQVVCTIHGNVNMNVSNFIGGYFMHENANAQHENWLLNLIETLFSPSLGRAHQQRPTLAQLPVGHPVADGVNPNFYDLMLNFDENKLTQIQSFVSAVNAFNMNNTSYRVVPLYAVLEKTGGITTLSHTVEPVMMPTWHFLNTASLPITTQGLPVVLTHTEFAAKTHFMVKAPVYKHKLEYPSQKCKMKDALYLVKKGKPDKQYPPYKYKIFDSSKHISSDVLLFQPYDRNLERASFSTTLGIKIVSEDIDAAVLPLPNLTDSLHENNSAYIQGSVPIEMVQPIMISTNQQDVVRIIERAPHSRTANGFALRDGHQNIIPVFADEDVDEQIEGLQGLIREENHVDPDLAFTYTAWTDGEDNPVPDDTVHLWSSYRHVKQGNTVDRQINMYYSFRPMYGLGIPLIKISDPVYYIPNL